MIMNNSDIYVNYSNFREWQLHNVRTLFPYWYYSFETDKLVVLKLLNLFHLNFKFIKY